MQGIFLVFLTLGSQFFHGTNKNMYTKIQAKTGQAYKDPLPDQPAICK